MMERMFDLAFNTASFLFFLFPPLFLLYALVPGRRGKNAFLLIASLIFYAAGQWQGLPFLLLAALLSWAAGVLIPRVRAKRALLALVLALDLSMLGVFKYLNFLTGIVNGLTGLRLPEGLKESDKLPEPIYTPSTKAEIGDHDENIYYKQSSVHLEKHFPGKGEEYAKKLRDCTLALYKKCADYALTRGIIIADTKFEFGLDEDGSIVLGDEMLTPDSSRFWPADGYEPGHGQPSFDKQFARDWLKANPGNDWTLPEDIVEKTIGKYLQAYEMLTGKPL